MTRKRVTVVGGGAWGTALGVQAVRAGADVELILRRRELAHQINEAAENRLYLPGVSLPEDLRATTSVGGLRDCDAVFLVTPAQYLRATLQKLTTHWPEKLPAIICCKGIEKGTGALMARVVSETLANVPVAVLSGPTFAHEVAKGLPAAVTLACADRSLGKELVDLIGTPAFRPYYSNDVVGVEVAGAIKNVLAIASGVVSGLELGDNARAALITRGLAEMSRLATAMGGQAETMMGLAGLGDLALTCTGTSSRNYSFGLALGQGRKTAEILAERRTVTEGVHTAASITAVAAANGVEMPICEAVDQVVNKGRDLRGTIEALLNRPFRDELEAAS